MGLLNFVKDAGEKLWNSVTGNADEASQSAGLKAHLDALGLPDTGNLDVRVNEGKVTLSGDVSSQEVKEKILVAAGNVAGISDVEDNIHVAQPESEGTFYTVKSGDNLSGIAKAVYGNAGLYNKIFEANKPMLTSPDRIYPGQMLRIPQ